MLSQYNLKVNGVAVLKLYIVLKWLVITSIQYFFNLFSSTMGGNLPLNAHKIKFHEGSNTVLFFGWVYCVKKYVFIIFKLCNTEAVHLKFKGLLQKHMAQG